MGMTADGGVWAWGNRLDKPVHVSPLKQQVRQWMQKLGIRADVGQVPGFACSASPELVLRFVQAGTNGTASTTPALGPGR